MIRLGQKWQQDNSTDKIGPISASRSISLDNEGYVRLSSRPVSVYTSDPNATEFDADIGTILTIGRHAVGEFTSVTSSAVHGIVLDNTTVNGTEDEETGNPAGSINAWGAFWQNRWYASTSTTVIYKSSPFSPSSGSWTTGIITGLTAGVTHALEVFRNRNTLAVTDGNVVRQYDTGHSAGTAVTLPSDFEAVGLAYSGNKMGIITRLSSNTEGQGSDAYFFVWDGSSTSASVGVPIGSDSAQAIVPYKGTWVILTRTGQLLIWNGGGFQELAAFPFYYTPYIWGDFTAKTAYGQCMWVEGDVIYMNLSFVLDAYGRYQQTTLPYCPSGVWAYDPRCGLYHKYGSSMSTLRSLSVTSANVNTSTDILTTSDYVPPTGSIAKYVSASGTPIGGLLEYYDYYVIKLSSTTFQLATSYENAQLGIYIDLTSTGAATNSFYSIAVYDYNATVTERNGAITGIGTYELWGDHVIYGSQVYDFDSTTAYHQFQTTIPNLENRGYFVTPKLYAAANTDVTKQFVVRHSKLKDNDVIVVREKSNDAADLPITTASVTWFAANGFSTTSNIAPVLTAYQSNEAIEVEVLAGFGGGWIAQVASVTYENGTYSVELSEDIQGATTGMYSRVQFDNFKEAARITATTQSPDGVFSCPIGKVGRWSQYKVELRGINTTIEDVTLVSVPHKLPV